ncbi:MAG: hypothetical protein LBR28_00680 [Bacteroidales bacterium]|jgi:hypothetical protein|nr:hypothetical protein [Bacteroidales bacterium]
MNKTKKIILLILKGLTVLTLFYLFFDPVLKIKQTKTEKPIVVITQDNSASINEEKNYKEQVKLLAEALDKDYDLKFTTFGSTISNIKFDNIETKLSFNDYCTDISQTLEYIIDKYSNQNLSAVILLSDGIVNRGKNPLNTCDNIHFPVISVALGDTATWKDLYIADIRYNRIAYRGNDFPLEIVVGGTKAKGERSIVNVKKAGTTIYSKEFVIDDNSFSQTFLLTANAEKAGIERFIVNIKTIDKEKNITNNQKEIFVEVLDNREKVLILANSPHPDISILKESLKANQNYEVTSALIEELPQDFLTYNAVILHQLPSNNNNFSKIQQLINNNVPVLFILGSQTSLSLLNKLQTGFTINITSDNTNQATATFNPDFALFTLSKNAEQLLRDLPPLICPAGKFSSQSASQTLAYQKIGNVNTMYPLFAFCNNSNGKTGLIAGENIWKWRLHNYLVNQTHNEIDEILQKSVQIIANKVDKSRFRIICDKIFNSNQPVIIQAELYNENYELVNTSDVTISITDEQSKIFNFTFSKTFNAYNLNVGRLSNGHYDYVAKTSLGGKNYTVNGSFEVSKDDLEKINLTADHLLLYNISHKTGGKMFYPEQMQDIVKYIKSNEQIKPMIYQTEETKRLLSCWWYWLIVVILLSAEWGLRKYWGN